MNNPGRNIALACGHPEGLATLHRDETTAWCMACEADVEVVTDPKRRRPLAPYEVTLSDRETARLVLPADLTQAEADRICGVIQALVTDQGLCGGGVVSKSLSEARQEITGDSWLDKLARASLSAAETKFSGREAPLFAVLVWLDRSRPGPLCIDGHEYARRQRARRRRSHGR